MAPLLQRHHHGCAARQSEEGHGHRGLDLHGLAPSPDHHVHEALGSMHATPRSIGRSGMDRRGFTLVELMITLTVLAAVMVVLMTVIYAAQRSKISTSNRVESAQAAR